MSTLTDSNGKVTGRTPSTNPEWFKSGIQAINPDTGKPYTGHVSVADIQQATSDHEQGKPLKPKQKAILRALSDIASEEEQAQSQSIAEVAQSRATEQEDNNQSRKKVVDLISAKISPLFGKDTVSNQVQNDGQKVLDAFGSNDLNALLNLQAKYQKDAARRLG